MSTNLVNISIHHHHELLDRIFKNVNEYKLWSFSIKMPSNLFPVLRVGSGVATDDHSSKKPHRLCKKRLQNWRREARAQQGAVEPLMNIWRWPVPFDLHENVLERNRSRFQWKPVPWTILAPTRFFPNFLERHETQTNLRNQDKFGFTSGLHDCLV
jgi:hypothetical protein